MLCLDASREQLAAAILWDIICKESLAIRFPKLGSDTD